MDADRALNFVRRNKPLGGFDDEDMDAVDFYLSRGSPGFGIWNDGKLDTAKMRRVLAYRNKEGRPLILGDGTSRPDVDTTSKVLSFLEGETGTGMQYIFPKELMVGGSKEFKVYTGKNFRGKDRDYKDKGSNVYALSGIIKSFHDFLDGSWESREGNWSFTLGKGKKKIGVACIETSDASGTGRGGSYSALIVEGKDAGEIVREIVGGKSYETSSEARSCKEASLLVDNTGMGHIEPGSYRDLTEKLGGRDPVLLSGFVAAIMGTAKRLGHTSIGTDRYFITKKGDSYALYK